MASCTAAWLLDRQQKIVGRQQSGWGSWEELRLSLLIQFLGMRQSWDKRLGSRGLQTPDNEWKQTKPTNFYRVSLFSTIFRYIFPQTDAKAGGQPGSARPVDREGSSPLLFRQQKLAQWSPDHSTGHRAMVVSVSFIHPS